MRNSHLEGSPSNRIDLICDAYEAECLRGAVPDLRSFFAEVVGSDETVVSAKDGVTLFEELLLLNVDYRTKQGESVSKEMYLTSFPEFAECIEGLELKSTVFPAVPETVIAVDCVVTDLPHQILQYQLIEKLGEGGAGEVWQARDTRLKRIVAMKFPHRNPSREQLHRFLREGRTLAQLRHPHIVAVYDAGRVGSHAYIVSEYVEGGSLKEAIKQGRFHPRRAAELCILIANALHYAHLQGVVHRDLKPANILLDHAGHPHVADFGLAKWSDDSVEMTLQGQLLGTLSYMSPEQAQGDALRVDGRTDVYALGCMIYEMLTGSPPFYGEIPDVVNAVLNENPPSMRSIDAEIPRDLETICGKAMQKQRSKRYATAADLAADLNRFVQGEVIHARRAGILELGIRAIRRRPALSAVVLLGLVVASLAVLAQRLISENRQLTGVRPVSLNTIPAGARVTFVPLDDATNEPLPTKMVRASMASPVRTELRPGNYLVVAVLTDGSFHEVFRHVPNAEENLPGHHNHLHWSVDASGQIVLPDISIPTTTVLDNMARIDHRSGKKPNRTGPRGRQINGIYVDFQEVSVADYKRLGWHLPIDRSWRKVPENYALAVRYDSAVAIAEAMGKRLPSREEYDYVARRDGASLWPWGNSDPPPTPPGKLGPLARSKYDRLADDQRVVGLVTNVAEWTTSTVTSHRHNAGQAHNRPSGPATQGLINREFYDRRVVVGGYQYDLNGNVPAEASPLASGSGTKAVPRGSIWPGLGFRCVRSIRPRDILEAF